MRTKEYLKRVARYLLKGVPVVETKVIVKEHSPHNVLANRCILITGGSSGIGFYIARKCLAEGASVCITGRDINKLRAAQEKLGENCFAIQHDVSDIKSYQKIFLQCEKLFGRPIDDLVSNAGISLHEGSFYNVTEAGWDSQMGINLKANYFICKAFIEYREKQESTAGNILVITSDRGSRADDIPYGLTKVASNSFVRGFAHKIVQKGIRINALAPGVTCSELTGYSRDENMYFESAPGKRVFLPEEMANVAKFLLSEESSCISGEIINCDQGFYIAHW